MGWDAGVEKLFDCPMRPRIAGEYMFGSGDGNRRYTPTGAKGGNRGNARDASFAGFGLRDTGISLAPQISNLHIWKLSAISDPTADMFNGYVGAEMDYFVNWRLSSDLSWTVRWGTFFPGGAYSDQYPRHFIFTGLTWSF